MAQRLGRIVNDSVSDYLIPVHADIPRFDVCLVPEDDPHFGAPCKRSGVRLLSPQEECYRFER
jgi:xanthine dehydrogenase YagR molybdenum-binding subunit